MSDIPPPPEPTEATTSPVAWDPLAPPRPEPGSIYDLPYAAEDDPLDVTESRWSRAPKLPKLGRASRRGPAPSHALPGAPAAASEGPVMRDLPTLPGMADPPRLPGPAPRPGPSEAPRLPPASSLPATTWEPTYQPSERALAPPPPPASPPTPAPGAAPAAGTAIDWTSSWSPAAPAAPPPGSPPPPPASAPSGVPALWSLGLPAAPEGPPAVDRPRPPLRYAEGILVGVAAAALAGLAWWAVAALTHRQFVYLAVLIGFGVGRAVVVGARRGSPALGVFALGVTVVALAVAEYFIQRSLAIESLHTQIPLWSGLDFAREVVRTSLTDDPLNGVFWLVAAGIAGYQAALPSAKPVL